MYNDDFNSFHIFLFTSIHYYSIMIILSLLYKIMSLEFLVFTQGGLVIINFFKDIFVY